MLSHPPAQIALGRKCLAPLTSGVFGSAAPRAGQLRNMPRAEWVARCVHRLCELRPGEDLLSLATLVDELYLDLPGFHPALAAEMEYECRD